MLLSVVIPVYNERRTLGATLLAVARALPNVGKEIIVVDDCSKDGTREWLKANFPDGPRQGSAVDLDGEGNLAFAQDSSHAPGPSTITIRPIFHEHNRGKGGGLQTGFSAIRGDVLVIQDADLEYDPSDWGQMYDLIATRGVADVVFGSRFYGRPHRSLYFHHYLAQPIDLVSLQYPVQPDPDGHRNLLQDDDERCRKIVALDGKRFRHRGGNKRPDRAAAQSSHL
jgi:glycosyltransferase involved in cell wall biosynthesis